MLWRTVRSLIVVLSTFFLAVPAFASHDGRWHVEERASVTEDGDPAPWHSASARIDAAGDVVVFEGGLPFLQEPTGAPTLMFYDRTTAALHLAAGLGDSDYFMFRECLTQGPAISGDGRYVLFGSPDQLHPSDDNDLCDVYVYDRETGSVGGDLIDIGYESRHGAIAAGGRYVALSSLHGVSVVDRESGTTTQITQVDSGRVELSADGRLLAFRELDISGDVVLVDIETGETERPTRIVTERHDPTHPSQTWSAWSFALSSNMRFLAYATEIYSDEDPEWDVGRSLLIHDRETGTNTEINFVYEGLTTALGETALAVVAPFFRIR